MFFISFRTLSAKYLHVMAIVYFKGVLSVRGTMNYDMIFFIAVFGGKSKLNFNVN